ncbi:Ribonuclease 1, partial [Linum perenne]
KYPLQSFFFISTQTTLSLQAKQTLMMKPVAMNILIQALIALSLTGLSVSKDFDFFYFVQQWPGSYCDSQQKCCYPTTGKPSADFGIHGLWPNYQDGTYPSNCDSGSPFVQSKVSDLISTMQKNWPTLACPSGNGVTFWSHEWEKHGTCSEEVLDQHSYFAKSLSLKSQTGLLDALTSSGINPDGQTYTLTAIKTAIQSKVGYTPFIECNKDDSGNSQLYQVYLCVDSSGSNLIECPVYPHGKCGSDIEFPEF